VSTTLHLTERRALKRVSTERLGQLTFDLVRVRSYTGDTAEVAALYARRLADLGLEIEVHRDYPTTPVVIARLRGEPGPTLTLGGHLDTVPVEHPEPVLRDGVVYGRGAADMKSALAAFAEVARAVVETGVRPRGTLQIIANGRHEAPIGHGEDLAAVVRRGLGGDACLFGELGVDSLPLVGLGMAIFEVTLSREGEPTHELQTPDGTPHPLWAAARALARLGELAERAGRIEVPRIGRESLFLGIVEGGDFYNRFPTRCRIVGTRRWGPDRSVEDIRRELAEALEPIPAETGCRLDLKLDLVKDSFEIRESEPLVGALRSAYLTLSGRELPLGGSRVVADAPIYIREGGVPCVYHGVLGHGAHADLEYVEVEEIARAARVYLLTALRYLDPIHDPIHGDAGS
jgi:acetylornithine deacetylase